METWFLNHVLGLCVSVLLLAVPGPLGAGGTPSNNSSDSVTAGFHPSPATDELNDMENNATSTSYSSESLSPSQRNILLTHSAEKHTAATAANYDTEQMQTFTETSSSSLEPISLSTEPLSSTLVVATTEASSSGGSSSTSSRSSDSRTSSSGSSSGGRSSDSSTSSSSTSSSSTSGSGSSSTSGSGSSSGSSSTSTSSSGSSSGTSSSSTSGSGSSSTSGSGSSSTGSSGSSSSGSTSSSSSSSGSGSGSSSSGGSGSSRSSDSSTSSSGSSSSSGSTSSTSTSGSSTGSTGSTGSSGSSSSSMGWKDVVSTEQVPGASPAVSWEVSSLMFTEEARMPQDSPDSTLRQGDASYSAVHTDSTYTSRTLLSVTSSNNNTFSLFTDDSHQPPSTWGATETEDYTHSAPSTSTDSGDTTDKHMTSSFKGMFSESPGESRGTQSFNGQPNTTQHHHHPSTPSEDTSDSTPPLRLTEPSTDQSEVSVSSTPPITSPAGGPTNISGTDQGSGSSVGTSTESSTGVRSSSTQDQQGTEGVSSHTSEHSVGLGLTTGPPTVSSSTSELDDSLTVRVTEVFLTTTPVTVTQRPHITEENTFKATASTSTSISTTTSTATTTTTTTTTSPPPVTSSPRVRSTTSSSAPESPTESTEYAVPSTAASTVAPRTSAATHRASSSPTQGPSTGMANPTKATTLQIETSTGTLGITTTLSQRITTTYTHTTPTKSTEAQQTTGKQTDRETTRTVVTTTPTDITSTKASPPAPPPPRNPCVSNPCMNGGMCVSDKGHHFTCRCQQAWTGPTCNHDVDECEKDPCPAGSRCVNTRGSFSCECPLGFDLEDGRTCTRAKTFLGTFSVNMQPHDPVVFKSTTLHEIQREIIQLLNASLSVLRGYSRSLLSKKGEDGVRISAVNMFSISTDVTSAEVHNNIQMTLSNCSSSLAHCSVVLNHKLTYHVESLCVAQKTQCDTERSTCTDTSGTAQCQCLPGYYKHNPDDLSCLECGDGYKLENGTCVPCMFGFGGFNCGNFYKLIAVVVSPAGGALLLILIIALIVTCCKKDKNDINKIIFKSGDLQMSPYADFPKNNRISMEWGRETIEMQENGSTKNLLQMTDIYYSPALRNSDLERNGLYPFTGLPGSRHSCIYPAQWNPSFISDDSRRRDYF